MSLCTGGSHRWQEGGLLVVGQRTKEQQFPSKRAEEMLPEFIEAQHHTSLHNYKGLRRNSSQNTNLGSMYKDWSLALSSLWPNGDRREVANNLKRLQDLQASSK